VPGNHLTLFHDDNVPAIATSFPGSPSSIKASDAMPWANQLVLRAPSLHQGEIHVWSIRLQDETGLLSDHAMLLSNEELRRADSLRFEIDRLRLYRRSRHSSPAPRRLYRLSRSIPQNRDHGRRKPFLANSTTCLPFNVSNSADRSHRTIEGWRLGIDLEDLRFEPRIADLAESICSANELEGLEYFTRTPKHERYSGSGPQKRPF